MASPSSGRTFTGERMDEDINFPACLKAARTVFRIRQERPEFKSYVFQLSSVTLGICLNVLSLNFLICNMEKVLPILQVFCEH